MLYPWTNAAPGPAERSLFWHWAGTELGPHHWEAWAVAQWSAVFWLRHGYCNPQHRSSDCFHGQKNKNQGPERKKELVRSGRGWERAVCVNIIIFIYKYNIVKTLKYIFNKTVSTQGSWTSHILLTAPHVFVGMLTNQGTLPCSCSFISSLLVFCCSLHSERPGYSLFWKMSPVTKITYFI